MRPDNLAVYAVLKEAQRLSKTRGYRKFRPAIVAAVNRLMAEIPEPTAFNSKLRPLIGIYRNQLNLDDVKTACNDLGFEEHADAIATVMRPHLWRLFDGVLQWHDNGDVYAVVGNTMMETIPSEVPLKDGVLHGTIRYGDEKYTFYRGFLLPQEPLSPEVVERYYDDEPFHRVLVGLIGIDVYLAWAPKAQSWKEGDLEYRFTDRYAILLAEGRSWSAPTRMFHMDDVRRWYAAKLAEAAV